MYRKKLHSIFLADDTSAFLERNDLSSLSTITNKELAKLSIWLTSNKPTLNIDKSHYVFFLNRARRRATSITLLVSNISLERVTFTEFLGVIIDEKISFTRHIIIIIYLFKV